MESTEKTMDRKKVCHMTSAHGKEDVRIFHKECVSLAKAGYEVYLVERGESYVKNGVHVVGVGDIPGGRLERMTQGAKKVYQKALELDCDIYHFHDPELLPYGLKLKRKGKIVIFDSHEFTRRQILVKPYLPSFIAKILYRLYSSYENYVLRRIDGVIFPCPIQGEFPLPGKKRAYVNNVPMLSEMYDRWDPNAEKLPDSICTVGSLSAARGVKEAVLAAHRAGAHLYLGGAFSPSSLEEQVRNMPEFENTKLLGVLDRDGVCSLLNRCCVGVSSILNVGQYNLAENLPTKVYEFMAMGLPVIMTRNAFNERMVRQYCFGICVDPENIEEFAGAIRDLLDHPEKARELGENGRRVVKEVFNWENEMKNLLNLYQGCLCDH